MGDDLKICPGFVLEPSPAWSNEQDSLVLMDLSSVDFRRGIFHIETIPGLDYRISVKVKFC